MNNKLNQISAQFLRRLRRQSKEIVDKLHPVSEPTDPATESKIQALWEQADFEALISEELQPSNKSEINIINEAKAALKLLNTPILDNVAKGRKIRPTESYKTVTILHSSLPHHPGGYSNRAQGLLKGIKKLGVEIVGYTRPGFYREIVDKSAVPPFPTDLVDEVNYHHLADSVRRGRGEFQYMYSCIEIYRDIFASENPDVVHVRSTFLIALPAIIAAKSLGIPVVYEISGLWELVYEGRGEIGRAKRATRMENASVLGATRTVTMNSAMAELLKSRVSRPVDIGLVPNAVDLTKFSDLPEWETQDEQYDLGYIGSLVDYEGLDLLLHAIAHLRDNGYEFTAKIVGRGHQLEILQELASSLQLNNLVAFTGPVPADQVQKHFAQIRIIVLPRKTTPATERVTPLKPFEAMASKRALITSDVSALNELSQHGTATTVFRSGDYIALAEAILRLSTDELQRKTQIENAFEMVRGFHSWDNIATIMEAELREHARADYSFHPRSNFK